MGGNPIPNALRSGRPLLDSSSLKLPVPAPIPPPRPPVWNGYYQPSPMMDLKLIKDQVAKGLKNGGLEKLDIFGFDACLMMEYANIVNFHGLSHYYLAAEDLEPGAQYQTPAQT